MTTVKSTVTYPDVQANGAAQKVGATESTPTQVGNIIFPVSYVYIHAWHLTSSARTREKAWVTNASASVTELWEKKKVITGDSLSQALSDVSHWAGYTKPAPSTSIGNAATIFSAYRHCHTLKMINEEIFLQHLDTASAHERHSQRDSKLSIYSDLSCHVCKCL